MKIEGCRRGQEKPAGESRPLAERGGASEGRRSGRRATGAGQKGRGKSSRSTVGTAGGNAAGQAALVSRQGPAEEALIPM